MGKSYANISRNGDNAKCSVARGLAGNFRNSIYDYCFDAFAFVLGLILGVLLFICEK